MGGKFLSVIKLNSVLEHLVQEVLENSLGENELYTFKRCKVILIII
jgi:hypothetical protein